jgi:phenylpyruvate tautomerase PptA (4-oxalocrotonate tautomerase family)
LKSSLRDCHGGPLLLNLPASTTGGRSMPIVDISMRAGKPEHYRKAVIDGFYRAMRDALQVPEDDQFITITEHDPVNFRYGARYLDVARSDDLLYIRITVFDTRTTAQKKALYQRAVELLGQSPGVRREDVFIVVLEAAKENWSLGNGVAQFA